MSVDSCQDTAQRVTETSNLTRIKNPHLVTIIRHSQHNHGDHWSSSSDRFCLRELWIAVLFWLTFVVWAYELVSGVAREVPRVPQPEPVPGPLDHTDLVLDTAGKSYLKIRRMCQQSVKTSRISKQKLISAQSNSVWTQRRRSRSN